MNKNKAKQIRNLGQSLRKISLKLNIYGLVLIFLLAKDIIKAYESYFTF